MADQLATPEDLASIVERDDLIVYQAELLIECATAVVQAACGQRIVQVVDDELTILGGTSSWLELPEHPVTAVSAVSLDGATIAGGTPGTSTSTWKRYGSKLWRGDGWYTYCGTPAEVVVTYTHGYPPGHQKLQLGRSAVLAIAKGVASNPKGTSSRRIDDYSESYSAAEAALDATPHLKTALQRQYGRRAGLVRIG